MEIRNITKMKTKLQIIFVDISLVIPFYLFDYLRKSNKNYLLLLLLFKNNKIPYTNI